MAERGVAPARMPRKHASGTPRAAVRPNYVGLPSMAVRGTDERGRKPPGSGAEEAAVGSLVARPRGAKSPRWSAERRASGDPDARAARRDLLRALLGAPLPHVRGRKEMKAHPAPCKQQGRRSVGYLLRPVV